MSAEEFTRRVDSTAKTCFFKFRVKIGEEWRAINLQAPGQSASAHPTGEVHGAELADEAGAPITTDGRELMVFRNESGNYEIRLGREGEADFVTVS